MAITFGGPPFNPLTIVKGRIIMTHVKIVRKTLFRNIMTGVDYCCRGERLGSAPNMTSTGGDL